MEVPQTSTRSEFRKDYLRPLWLSVALSVFGALLIFLIFGRYLFPTGNLLHIFRRTVVYCGIGMGATMGTLINVIVVGRWQGPKAVLATTGLSIFTLGVMCGLLCLSLDRTFHYFGGSETASLFMGNGILMAGVGGLIAGALLFTKQGRILLTRIGL